MSWDKKGNSWDLPECWQKLCQFQRRRKISSEDSGNTGERNNWKPEWNISALLLKFVHKLLIYIVYLSVYMYLYIFITTVYTFILSLLHTSLSSITSLFVFSFLFFYFILLLYLHIILLYLFYIFTLYATFYSYIWNFCTICLKFSFYLCDFLYTYFLSIVGGSLRFKNFIANDCLYLIVVHMTIKILNLES